MVKPVPTLLAILVVVLFGAALFSMSSGDLGVAGVTFLCASLVIYLRAKWIQRDAG